MAGWTGYFTGKGDAPSRLQRMVQQGKEVAKQERSRWQQNRMIYRGDQWFRPRPGAGFSSGRLEVLSEGARGRRRDTFNRLRQMTDGRVSTLTASRPPYEVIPKTRDQQVLDAARQAKKLIAAKWEEGGWNVGGTMRELVLTGEIDGVSFLNCTFDPNCGEETVIYVKPDGQPISTREEYEAAIQQDPDGGTLWMENRVRLGEIVWRVVRPGAVAVDPSALHWKDVNWVIESRVLPKAKIEMDNKVKIDKLLKDEKNRAGNSNSNRDATLGPVVAEDEGQLADRVIPGREEYIVHEMYMKPSAEWPKGCHAKWLDRAPGQPLMVEEYPDYDLPYRPFNPKPDGGHYMRCRGTVDELRPIQQRFNRVLSLLSEWMEKVARPPVLVPVGSLRNQELYNEKGFAEVHPIGDPHFMPTPSEPVAVLTQHLQWCVQQMAEIANQSDALRGMQPGGVESAVGIQALAQNSETQLSGTASQVASMIEWGLSRSLRLVRDYYSIPRLVQTSGVDSSDELSAFVGEMVRDAEDVQITASILPRSRALQFQTLMQLAPLVGQDIRPYVARFVEGSYDEFISAETAQRDKQQRENRSLAALGKLDERDQVWADFSQISAQYMQAFAMASGEGNPEESLMMAGIQPPSVLRMLRDAGVNIPRVEDYDDHAMHLRALDLWRLSDGFDAIHPLVKQAAREHAQEHKKALQQQLVSMGGQTPPEMQAPGGGSPPAEKGNPSPPKESGGPNVPIAGAM
jgi:hypothetical protein